MQILSTANLDNQFLKILAYGDPGTGKTFFAGSMNRKIKALGLSAEAGLLSLQNLRAPSGELIAVDYITINRFEDMEEAFVALHHGALKGKYQGVFIDSLTEIQKACMDHILEKTKKDAMEMRDWGTLAMKIERMVRSFRDLPMHVVVTALAESEVDQATGEVRVMPMLKGSVQKNLAAFFDEVFYVYSKELAEGETRKIHHHILTRNSGKYIGKDRSGRLPPVIVDPDFEKVYTAILGKEKA